MWRTLRLTALEKKSGIRSLVVRPGKRYIQTQEITVEHAGIELSINVRENNWRDGNGIAINYCVADNGTADIALIPKMFNSIELRAADKLRKPR